MVFVIMTKETNKNIQKISPETEGAELKLFIPKVVLMGNFHTL